MPRELPESGPSALINRPAQDINLPCILKPTFLGL